MVWSQGARGGDGLVNYAFSAWLGTGVYSVGDRSVAVLTVPVAFTEVDEPLAIVDPDEAIEVDVQPSLVFIGHDYS